ncbi:MAG: substrate-binding domain-containing protein [Planctomycetes bacterium]|nr:substrate-binding domain-containing protein [Planctomycetota bacterium]
MNLFVRHILLFISVSYLSGLQITAEELTLAGSTTVQKRVLEPLLEGIKKSTNIDLKIRGINSGRGFAELVNGKIPASISSNPLEMLLEKANLPNDGTYQEHIIIQDVIVPIVHTSNPVTSLSWQQLSDINTGKITNWKDLGGEDRKIIVVTSQPTAATRIVFQKIVMKKEAYITGVREVKSTRQEVDVVSKFRGGIGAVSEGFVAMNPGKVKVIKTEIISRPLSIITKGKPNSTIQALIDYIRTPKAKLLFK